MHHLNQRNFLLCLVVLLASLFVIRIYFHAGFPYTHDGENHLARFANYALAIREGQFPPRFAPNLMNHYGYPVFNFNYPLANMLSLAFSALKINYELTFKIIVSLAVAVGGVGSYFWLRQLGYRRQTALLAIFVFASNLYLINAIVFRGNIGEIFAICLLPWVFAGVETLLRSKQIKVALLFTFMLAAFLLSHNIAAVFSLPLIIIYAVFRWFKSKNVNGKKLLLVLTAALGLTLWFWLPAVAEKSLTVVDQVGVNTAFAAHFPTLTQLLFAPLTFGFSYPGSIDSLSFSLGWLQVSIVFLAITELFVNWQREGRKFWHHHEQIFYLGLVVLMFLLFIFQLAITKPIWDLVSPLAKYLQFPWRLGLFWGIFILPLWGFAWENTPRIGKTILIVLLIAQLWIITQVKPADYFHRSIEDYNFFAQSTSVLNENRSKTFTYTDIGDWQPTPQVLSGIAEVNVQKWRGSKRNYDLLVQQESVIVEPTMYFAGWETTANGQSVSYINSEQIGGRLGYRLPVGEYQVQSRFTQRTWSRIIGNSISLLTVLGLVVISLKSVMQKKHV